MGALTASIKKRNSFGASTIRVIDITGSSSYATNGETYTNQLFELNAGVDIIIDGNNTPGYNLVFDLPNKKIKFFVVTTGVEVANATNLSAVTGRILVIGDEANI